MTQNKDMDFNQYFKQSHNNQQPSNHWIIFCMLCNHLYLLSTGQGYFVVQPTESSTSNDQSYGHLEGLSKIMGTNYEDHLNWNPYHVTYDIYI